MKRLLKFFLPILMIVLFISCTETGESKNKQAEVTKKIEPQRPVISVQILFHKEEYDEELKIKLPKLNINERFLKTADEGIRAILAYYSAIAGTDCWWNKDKANADYSNLNCELTSALNLGNQCSKSHQSLLQKWFSEEKDILKAIDECYSVPYTATIQTTYDYLNLEVENDEATVSYKMVSVNVREEASSETIGVDKFRIGDHKINVISRGK